MPGLESCEPLFEDLETLFFDFETWEGFSVWIGKGSLSWIWIGRISFVEKLNFQAVIKSAASTASLRGGRASGRLDHGFCFAIFGRASGQKIVKISDSGNSC